MRSSFAPRGGFTLMKTPSSRDQATQRRLVVGCALTGLAIAAGMAGSLLRPSPDPVHAAATGPFSYISSQ